MNRREKEEYLREYNLVKAKGKPFFPYAVAKDGAMAVVVLLVIIFASLMFGAEVGAMADPTSTTFTPRPEWYFFFLFELLKVIKDANLTPLATIGIPTIGMILLLLLPFYDRGPERAPWERPIATTAGCLTIFSMALLTYMGASAGSPTEIDKEVPAKYEAGKIVVAQAGCLGCHKIGENGNPGPGPDLTKIGERLPAEAIARTLRNPSGVMPSYANMSPEKSRELVKFLAYLGSEEDKEK